MTALAPQVRLYNVVRTAHLERARELAPATIVYSSRRYDFDESAARGLDLRHAGLGRVALLLLLNRVEQLEINEPLLRVSMVMTTVALAALRVRHAVTRRRTVVVTYAIENLDPFDAPRSRSFKSRMRRRVELSLARRIAGRVDRIVFGTDGAEHVYDRRLPVLRSAKRSNIPALPQPREALPKRADSIVFLGALSERKGLPQALAAWRLVREARPRATLTVIGKGPLLGDAESLAAGDDRVRLLVDPPRAEIFAELDGAQVLVMPSQPSPTWREQVGLPIVEGLASGCSIVTTTETGLADWLTANGHSALDPRATAEELASVLEAQLESARPSASVTAALPARDGRLAADDWLFDLEASR